VDHGTQGERRSHRALRDPDKSVECDGCGSRPLVTTALGLVIIRPGASGPASTTWWCPRCTRGFSRWFYGLTAPRPSSLE